MGQLNLYRSKYNGAQVEYLLDKITSLPTMEALESRFEQVEQNIEDMKGELDESLKTIYVADIEQNILDTYDPTTADTYILKRGSEEYDSELQLTFTPLSPDSLVVPVAIGDITAGTPAEELKGKALSEILDSMLFKTIYPTIVNPSITLVSNTTVTVEAGSTLFSGYNYTFNRGTGNIVGATTTVQNYAGPEGWDEATKTDPSHIWYVTGTGGTANTNAGVSAYPNFTTAEAPNLTRYEPGTYKYKVTVWYKTGDLLKTSKGATPNPMPTSTGTTVANPRAADSLTSAEGYQRNVTLPAWIDTGNGTYTKQALQAWAAMTFTNIQTGIISADAPFRIKVPRKVTTIYQYNAVSGKYDISVMNGFSMTSITETINGKDYPYYEYVWVGATAAANKYEIKTY